MIRNIKALSLALVAVFAMSAVAAAGASAAEKFVAETSTAKVIAEQTGSAQHVFSVDGTEVKCSSAKFETASEVASPATSITVHPAYTGCTAFGFLEASVTTTGCDYKLFAAGGINVVCSGSNQIVISAATCEAKVPAQEIASGLTYKNEATSPSTVLVGAALSGTVKTNKTKDGFLCPLKGTGEVFGSYTGDTLAKGFNGVNQVGISVE